MKNESRRILNDMLNRFASLDYVHMEDVPNIDLYMDQVLTFLDQQLGSTSRNQDDKVMTKTMINNYTKNQILPPPEKKKYSRDHMLDLIIIYYLKNFLSMKDIKTILDPVNDNYFGDNGDMSIYDIYSELVKLENDSAKILTKDVIKKFDASRKAFSEYAPEDQTRLQNLAFICLLSFDVYVKKMMIEQFIDGLAMDKAPSEPEK